MKNGRCFWLRCVGVVSLTFLQGLCIASQSRGACYSTPRMAIDALDASFPSSPALRNGGYRVSRVEADQVLGQRWAMIARCDHPEWPAFALLANSLASSRNAERSVTEGLRTVPIV